ncbi:MULTISPECIES: mechanosensitive ion channel family protein [Pseudomonas]|uniref:Mechanosensitive ion channel family protein n=2 Tax=Pseudomonas luteola TaxID=47886 RepID=A0ABS0FKN4_PSELU|nr:MULTISPECIES: mechanosensitive ion channel domain-containing protein [Pseudomonas]MBF8640913.1 mechanosensitive ion channel family protein [Pseudomonas zeshuii]RRW45936.1 mechanosensitive ion channel family protein [Pseudomonas luteola]
MMSIDWSTFLSSPWLATLVAACVSMAIASIAVLVISTVLKRIARPFLLAQTLIRYSERPARFLIPLIALQGVLGSAPDTLPLIGGLRHLTALITIAAFTWLGLRCVKAIGATISIRHPVNIEDNLRARRIQTQTRVMVRSLGFVVFLVGLSSMLMTFPEVRQIGASLLASAGVAGIVAGIAARPVLGNLIAGLQIAVTQPIRIDDVVIVEGEWGRVEEITGTYVVVRIWDDRRLVVPLQYFIEKPFQNWTRTNSSLMGSVFMWVDYSLPMEPIRAELERVCNEVPHLWDGRVCVLQVTDASDRAIQLRVLVTSPDSSKNWDLRCHVRERLIAFVNREFPECLPQLRAEVGTQIKRPHSGSDEMHNTPARQPEI